MTALPSARPANMHDTLPERLARAVLQMIRDDDLTPGMRTPSVRKLATHFQVAQPTMREALSLLQVTGHVDIRHGSGVYVKDVGQRLLLHNPYGERLDARTIVQLLAARQLIEPPVAALAAQNASPEELDLLAAILESARAHLGGTAEEDEQLDKINMSFHRSIADASGNRVLAEVVRTLTEVRQPEQLVVLSIYGDRQRDLAQHEAVLAALTQGDAERARTLMAAHLQEVLSVVRVRMEEAA